MIFDTRFSEKESIRYGVVDGTATIVKYEGDEMRVVIPASIDGFKVTKIEPYAFRNVRKGAKIYVPKARYKTYKKYLKAAKVTRDIKIVRK